MILPLFALANAGVSLSGHALATAFTSPVTVGVAVGRVVGKVAGIGLATWLAVRSGLCRLPEGTRFAHVIGVGAAAGVAFTVSLFVAGLAFAGDPVLAQQAKVGVFVSALIAGPLGYVLLRRASARGGEPH